MITYSAQVTTTNGPRHIECQARDLGQAIERLQTKSCGAFGIITADQITAH
ncbi:hypothetical protein [Gordonia sp. NB41Y]|uniref:hypothetical protein n=1 Tax=Gordonia sp. NB41Y TaxID=875808 RepID=UPI0002BEC96A|nr:hypothetical protein [Gordonia sp. NB41Y]WLP90279.1 hypothetical protein Q9K23_22640 [Gordonia sp. NB41Y]